MTKLSRLTYLIDCKRTLLIAIAACVHVLAMAQDGYSHLVLNFKDNKSIAYALKDKPIMTFSDTELSIQSETITLVFHSLDSVSSMIYEKGNDAAVEDIVSDTILISVNNGNIILYNLPKESDVILYDIKGNVILNERISDGGENLISGNNLQSGVYIIKLNNQSFKIIIK